MPLARPISADHLSPPSKIPLDTIALSGLTVDCIIGLYNRERQIRQPLRIDIEIQLDTRPIHEGKGFSGTIDYARLTGELTFILEVCRFRMIESAAEAIARYILAPPTRDAMHAQAQAVTLTLTKPQALAGRTTPSVRIHRHASEYTYNAEEKPFGHIDTLYTSTELGFYRLHIKPNGHIPTHSHKASDIHELILGSALHLQGRPIARGTALHWPPNHPHRYDNPTETAQTLLCIASPPLLDEMDIDIPTDQLVCIEGRMLYPSEDADLYTPKH